MNVHHALRSYYIHKFGNLLFAFFFQIFVAKTLKPEQYATYAIFLAILMASERLFSFGLDRTMLRFVPSLTSHGDFGGLRWLAVRLGLVRIGSISTMLLALFLGAGIIQGILPSPVSIQTMVAFAAWLLSYSLLADADALAQSWVAHIDAATVGTFEILIRNLLIVCLFFGGIELTGSTVIQVSALTSSVAVVALLVRFLGFEGRIRILASGTRQEQYPPVDVTQAPMFAAAAYASTMGWLISSPAVVRIFAKGGLDLVSFAAFSFIQGICVSLQRGFPGQLMLPSLEPILVKFGGSSERIKMLSILSLVFKIELAMVLLIIIVTTIAGSELISLLSRPAYASYYYILPAITIVLLLQTIYRICETVMSIQLEHRVFLTLWPLSLVSIITLYLTVGSWGFWSVIGIPIVESILRVTFLILAHRSSRLWLSLDPLKSIYLILSASFILLLALLNRAFPIVAFSSILQALIGVATFVAMIPIIRPLRRLEADYVSAALPASFLPLQRIVSRITSR